MSKINELIKEKAIELLSNGTVDYVLCYKNELFNYSPSPYLFGKDDNLEDIVYNGFCGPNLSKTLYLTARDKKVCVFLKPCDTLSFRQLIKENKFNEGNIYPIGIECNGKLDIDKIKEKVKDTILSIDEDYDYIYIKGLTGEYKLDYCSEYFLDKCVYCKGKKHLACREIITVNQKDIPLLDRFEEVNRIENMSSEEKFKFWQGELSKCIRCNACRNICPACTCEVCVFDNSQSMMDNKVNANSFEERLYHIIKSFHVAGRCTDCGECSRVCPVKIPLHLLNRKYIKEIENNFGVYDLESDESNFPLSEYKLTDREVK